MIKKSSYTILGLTLTSYYGLFVIIVKKGEIQFYPQALITDSQYDLQPSKQKLLQCNYVHKHIYKKPAGYINFAPAGPLEE